MTCEQLINCVACGHTHLTQVLDLGVQPLANSYPQTPQTLPEYPLELNRCGECDHLQLSHSVDPKLLFQDYLYVSGTSQTLRDYMKWFATHTLSVVPQARNVLDIACNDGSQLDAYHTLGLKTYGIDPAVNLHAISAAKHEVVCDFLHPGAIQQLSVQKFDILVAQNVLAHTPDPLGFLKSCAMCMHDHSRLFVQTSQANMVKNYQFDTIYHEHVSFFNVLSMHKLVARAGLHLRNAFQTSIHGDSWLFEIGKHCDNPEHMAQVIAEEHAAHMHDDVTYTTYAHTCKLILTEFTQVVQAHAQRKVPVIGLGAAAKGMTLLNATHTKLDLIIDDNPLKQGRYTPGGHTPICAAHVLHTFDHVEEILFVPLAWNFFDEMRVKILPYRPHKQDKFLKYFPKVIITS